MTYCTVCVIKYPDVKRRSGENWPWLLLIILPLVNFHYQPTHKLCETLTDFNGLSVSWRPPCSVMCGPKARTCERHSCSQSLLWWWNMIIKYMCIALQWCGDSVMCIGLSAMRDAPRFFEKHLLAANWWEWKHETLFRLENDRAAG